MKTLHLLKLSTSFCLLALAGLAASQALPAPRSNDPIFQPSPMFRKNVKIKLPPQPQPLAQPIGPAMPASLTDSWPETPTVVMRPAPMGNNYNLPLAGDGPRSCWIPVYSFSVEKDLTSSPAEPHYLVRFLVRSGPWSDQLISGQNSIWPYDFQFHAVSRARPTVIAGRGIVKNVHWFWEEKGDPGLYGEVLIDTSRYFLSSP